MPSGLRYHTGALPRSKNVNVHFQGGGYSWRHVLGLFFSRGKTPEEGNLSHTYSLNGGLDWEGPFVENNSVAEGQSGYDPKKLPYQVTYAIHMNAVVRGRLFIWFKGYDPDETGPSGSLYRLYGKAIRRYEVQKVSCKATVGSPVIKLNWKDHGLSGDGGSKSDSVIIKKFVGLQQTGGIGGIANSKFADTALKVTVIDGNNFTITVPASSPNATSNEEQVKIVGLTVEPWGWVERRYNSDNRTWEEAALAVIGSPAITSINLSQSLWKTASGKYLSAVSGNFKHIMRVPDPFDGSQTAFTKGAEMARCTGDGPGSPKYLTEPTIHGDPANETVFGFLRPQAKPYEASRDPEFWSSTNAGATVSQSAISKNAANKSIAARCPIPCGLGDDGKIYGFCMERLTDHTGDIEFRPAYLLVADKTTALANGGSAFTVHEIGEALINSQSESIFTQADYDAAGQTVPSGQAVDRSSEASNTGLPTCVKHGSWLFFFYEEQEQGLWLNSEGMSSLENGWSNIKYFAIDTAAVNKPLRVRGALG
ncbi:hypothetical protein [Methylopila sp. M107]|uniref:hypothetical protein n=1 Tax=Methylopila sp. M107 TaxID=1101190 RepID=UPI000363B61F|nr:hypothetical protein [Methylopila sp. M107]